MILDPREDFKAPPWYAKTWEVAFAGIKSIGQYHLGHDIPHYGGDIEDKSWTQPNFKPKV